MVSQGDIVRLKFDPQQGTEQKGRRPALVVSNYKYEQITKKRAMVCPITNTDKDYPIHVRLDERTKTKGVVLSDQVRVVDLEARGFSFIEKAPNDIVEEVVDIINDFICTLD